MARLRERLELLPCRGRCDLAVAASRGEIDRRGVVGMHPPATDTTATRVLLWAMASGDQMAAWARLCPNGALDGSRLRGSRLRGPLAAPHANGSGTCARLAAYESAFIRHALKHIAATVRRSKAIWLPACSRSNSLSARLISWRTWRTGLALRVAGSRSTLFCFRHARHVALHRRCARCCSCCSCWWRLAKWPWTRRSVSPSKW